MAIRFTVPPITRALLASTLLLSILYAFVKYQTWMSFADESRPDQYQAVPWLTIVPSRSIYYPWVFALATLVEGNIFTLLIAVNTIFHGGKYLERAWGSKDFGKFLLVVSIVPNVTTVILYFIWFMLTGHTELASTIWISGGWALLAGFLVSFKQLVPEHTLTVMKSPVSIRVKHLPILFVGLMTIPAIFYPRPSTTITPFLLTWTGFLSSWTYLRFFKTFYPDIATSTRPLRGDASETFSFAGFFPEPLSGPINVVASQVFDLLVSIKVCTPFSQEDVEAGNARVELGGSIGARPSGGSGARAEAERRRQLALRALDARLQGSGRQQNTVPLAGITVGHSRSPSHS